MLQGICGGVCGNAGVFIGFFTEGLAARRAGSSHLPCCMGEDDRELERNWDQSHLYEGKLEVCGFRTESPPMPKFL